jgi:hypothetical protein
MIMRKLAPFERRVSRDWEEVLRTAGDGPDRLTYVPGLVGDVTEWIVETSMLPNRMMALGVALVVVGTIIGRKVLGPTGNMTHLYIVVLAPSCSGKNDPMVRGSDLIAAVVGKDADLILGDTTWRSGLGMERMLAEYPVRVCFIDEVGDQLLKINAQVGNTYVSETTSVLKIAYNNRAKIRVGRTNKEVGPKIFDPALSLYCAATPAKFWGGLSVGDLESGVVNRFDVLPVMDTPADHFRIIPYKATIPPAWLVEDLRKLPRHRTLDALDHSNTEDGEEVIWPKVEDWHHQRWGSGEAEELWMKAAHKAQTRRIRPGS